MIWQNDTRYIHEAEKVFTIAGNVSKRLKKYNRIDSEVLYPPPRNHDQFHCKEYGDYIFYPSRIDRLKRQRVLVEAARYLKSDTKILLAGNGTESEMAHLRQLFREHGMESRVHFLGFIGEQEKIDYYSRCLAVYFGAYDEDYGYVTLESFFSKKPLIVHKDAGGPLEFVKHDENGFVLDEDPVAVAEAIDQMAADKQRAKALGENGYQLVKEKNINWDSVIEKLLARC